MTHSDANASSTHADSPAAPSVPIAIVGLGALFPGSTTSREFWRDILEGRDRLTDIPRTHWLREDYFAPKPGTPDKVYAARGGFLPEVEFSPMEFGLPPSTLPATDTAQLLALVVAKHALLEATRGKFESVDRSRMSVMLGVASATELVGSMSGRLQRPIVEHAMRTAGLSADEIARVGKAFDDCYVPWQESTFPGLLGNVVAGRITNRLDLGGTNAVVDAACAGSLAAVSMAMNDLALGRSDLVLTGGVDALNDIFMFMCFAQTGALSVSGDCRPFSDRADGTMLGEGIGILALRRLEDAERDGDAIYAVIRGLGSSSDGKAKSIYAPSPQGQTLALRRAYELAGYGPETVGLIEAHGTGTVAGDAAEVEALRTVFEAAGAKRNSCALGTVKAQIGHTKAAAGAAGMIKAVLALHHKILPPTIKVNAPNAKLRIEESPFYLNTEARPWVHDAPHPRRASVSALGFGGTNFHVALEEYVGPSERPARLHTAPTELLLLSAQSPSALVAACRDTAAKLGTPGALTHLAKQSQLGFDAGAQARLAIVASDEADAREKLASAITSIEKSGDTPFSTPRGVHYGVGASAGRGAVALLFPGQGSQSVGMGADLAMHFECVRALWDDAAADVRDGDTTLAARVYPKPTFGVEARESLEKSLTATEWAQPALTATSLGMLRLLARTGLTPAMVGGHSLGEVTAGVAAGLYDERTAIAIARRRGELMAKASATPGAMTAVAADAETVRKDVAGLDVVLANHNAPKQVVISGSVTAIAEAEARLTAAKRTFRRLSVSTAFHSPLVSDAVAPFRAFLDTVSLGSPRLPLFANATAAPYPLTPEAARAQLAGAVASPVRFVEQVEAMYAAGARTFVEVGPDAVLSKLVERGLEGRPHLAVSLDQRGKHGLTALQTALGRLAVAGHRLDFAPLWEGLTLPEDRAAKPPAKFTVTLSGANYAKPYPTKEPPVYPPARTTPAAMSHTAAVPAAKPAATANGHHAPTNGAANPTQNAAQNPTLTSTQTPTRNPMHPMTNPTHAAPISATVPAATPAQPAAPVVYAAPPAGAAGWVDALQQLQAPAIAAQLEFQRLMAESHMAFLRAVETSFAAVLPGAVATAAAPSFTATPSAPVVPTQAYAQPIAQPAAAPAPWSPPSSAPVQNTIHAPAQNPIPTPALNGTHAVPTATNTAVSAPPASAPARPAAAPAVDLTPVLLAIVAEKTGYPAEMIDTGMDMEADLGIDSIKRVEILSAMRQQVPDLPQMNNAKMAATRTLAEIIALFSAALPAAANGAPAANANGANGTLPAAPPPPSTVAAPSVSNGHAAPPASAPAAAALPELTPILLAIVAEKTGYPAEMIDTGMDMEADLGIDSIKRVEILSAMRQQVPNLPQVNTAKMAAMRTLAQIIELMGASAAPAPAQPAAVQPAAASAATQPATPSTAAPTAPVAQPASSGVNAAALTPVLLAIVAEKTGYPAEMIDTGMDMEADLGIDSIKRVEILSAMRQQVPNLPQVQTAKMASMRTLAQIIGLFESAGAPTSATTALSPRGETAPDPADTVLRLAVRALPAPAAGFMLPGLVGRGRIAVTPDGAGVAAALVAGLRARGVDAFETNDVPGDVAGVLFLGGLRQTDRDGALAVNRAAFAAARSVAARFREEGGCFVTVQDTGGDFGLSGSAGERAWLCGLAALTKTAGEEWPHAAVRAIDLARGGRSEADVAAALLAELFAGGAEREVGLAADGTRITLVGIPTPLAAASVTALPRGAVFVVTGGARGVTAASIIALAKAAAPRVLLLGRTAIEAEPAAFHGITDEAALKRVALEEARRSGKPVTPKELGGRVERLLANREVLGTLAQLREAGAEARYAAIDVRDPAALGALLDDVRRSWGPIRGLVHGAGVLADALLDKKTDAQFDRVFDTKVLGLRALLDATRNDPLAWLCLFSSVAARGGNAGQADYAMANEILNKVAALESARRGPSCRVVSIGWGPWDGGMVTPTLRTHFASRGVALLPVDAGASAFVRELAASPSADRELVIGGGDAGLHGGASPRLRGEVLVSRATHPQLDGHRIKGRPVLPMVLALEWFARLARAAHPERASVQLRDARVVRGVPLTHFDGAGDRFTVTTSPGEGGATLLEVRDAAGAVRYAATLATDGAEPARAEPLNGHPLSASPWTNAQLYAADTLFHGPDFQVIRAIEGLSEHGARASFTATVDTGWPEEQWATDLAAVDGALQLAILCGLRTVGPTLPLRVGRIGYAAQPGAGPVHCALRLRSQTPERLVCDVALSDASGAPVADLVDVELYAVPSGTTDTTAS
jgi:acyl transferase domain-containing protein/acyl carrier protein